MQKPIRLDIDTTNDSKVYIDKNITQGDTLIFTINLFQGSQNLNLTGQTIHIIIKRSTGFDIEMTTTNPNLSFSGNTITAVFKEEYLCTDALGDTKGQIVLIDSNGESSTNQFIFEVKENLGTDVVAKSADKLDTLIGINEIIAEYNGNADNLAIQNALALQHEADLTQLNSDGTILANRLETDITNGTSTAERLETDITTGTNLAERLATDITNGTTVAIRVENAVIDGNVVINELQNVNWPVIQSFIDLMEIALSGMRLTDENGNYLTDENGNYFTM